MKIKNWSIISLIEYIIITLSIILSGSMWVQPEISFINGNVGKVLLISLLIVWMIFCHNRINKSQINGLIFVCVCILLCIVFHISYSKSTIIILFPIIFMCLFGIICNSSNRLELIYQKFVNIICVIAIISLLLYTFVFIFKIITPTSYYVIKWSWIDKVPSYYNLFYNPMPNGISLGTVVFPRNCGIFPEAPMFMYPLVLALLINKLILHANKSKKNLLLVVTILSTVSTTGYIVVVLLYSFEYISFKKHILLRIFFPFIMVSGTIIVYYLFIKKMDTSSGSIRTDHVFASLKAFINTNGLGCGIGNSDYVTALMKYKQGISVGLPYLLATGGIFWGAVYIIPAIKSVVIGTCTRNYERAIFTILFSLLLFMTACHTFMNTWFVFGITIFTWTYSPQDLSPKKVNNI